MKNAPQFSADGTSFHGTTIKTTVAKLRQLVGEPASESNDGSDKVNFDWVCRTDSGDLFTIYDWKEYRVIDENEQIEFHIGASDAEISCDAYDELVALGV